MKNFGKTTDIKDIITVGYEADNAVLYSTSQSLTNNQKAQARINIGAGTSSFDGNYNSLSNKPTIPTKTSQLNNDSKFATTSQVEAKYTKPTGGIPKTDLATAVQNSLTAADNAVKYTSQSLTDAQKDQARKNIGAGTSNFSGSYNDLTNRPTIPAAVSIVQSTGTSTSSVMSQKATTDAVNGKLSKTDNTNIEVLGTKKATTTLGGNQLYAPNGIIFGGTAAAAGLVTRGISGISVPTTGGACSKDNLYVNYDGNNDFNAGRQVVLNAGTVGNHLGSNMYQYTIPRGDIVKNWVEAKGYATSVKVNGNTIASSGGVVDIGTVVTDVSGKQDKITSSNKLSASLVSGLANVATSGSYNDLSNIPVINQDLTASGFTPVTNTYYKHTGTTTDLYTNGVIYFYNGTKYASLDGSTAVTEQVTVAVADWELDGAVYAQVPTNPIAIGDTLAANSTIPPFAYRATKTIGTKMGANSVVSLGYGDTASMRECANSGVAIGEVPTDSGNEITFYSVAKPTKALKLVVEIAETTSAITNVYTYDSMIDAFTSGAEGDEWKYTGDTDFFEKNAIYQKQVYVASATQAVSADTAVINGVATRAAVRGKHVYVGINILEGTTATGFGGDIKLASSATKATLKISRDKIEVVTNNGVEKTITPADMGITQISSSCTKDLSTTPDWATNIPIHALKSTEVVEIALRTPVNVGSAYVATTYLISGLVFQTGDTKYVLNKIS